MKPAEILADRIRQDFVAKGERRIPSMAALGEFYGVSRRVIRSATHILRSRGVVSFSRGGPILISSEVESRRSTIVRTRIRSADRVKSTLIERIKDQRYQAGDSLPKFEVLARELQVSPGTVSSAYHALVEGNYAYRSGKRFVVGRRPGGESGRISRDAGFIIMLVHDWSEWYSISRSHRTNRFVQALSQEAGKYGVRLYVASLNVESSRSGLLSFREAVREIDGDMGHYLGCIITFPPSRHCQTVTKILNYKRPAVWFDRHTDRHEQVAQRGLSRCYFSEESGVSAALAHIAQWGHRSAVFPYDPAVSWQRERLGLLAKLGAEVRPSIGIVGYEYPRSDSWCSAEALEILRRAASLNIPTLRNAFARLKAESDSILSKYPLPDKLGDDIPSEYRSIVALSNPVGKEVSERDTELVRTVWAATDILPVLERADYTMLICPNDEFAHEAAIPHFRRFGIDIPRHLSVLSFDHSEQLSFVPPSTIDFGFWGMGYDAFHTILGDVPIRKDRKGSIPSRAMVINRGTVGVPIRRSWGGGA